MHGLNRIFALLDCKDDTVGGRLGRFFEFSRERDLTFVGIIRRRLSGLV